MISVIPLKNEHIAWNEFVLKHPQGSLYHLAEWKDVIEKTYNLDTHYLMALRTKKTDLLDRLTAGEIAGILPLTHIKHFLFGNSLVSVPFFDFGGILADGWEAENALLLEAVRLSLELNAMYIELRHIYPLHWLDGRDDIRDSDLGNLKYTTKSHKVRMLLELPKVSEILMTSFKSKLRSQIRKASKEGLISRVGGLELVDDFYKVFSVNMRDLGSPVHSKGLMRNVLKAFPTKSRIFMIYKDDRPLACSLLIDFKDTLENPWASSLRDHARLCPNMLLYWAMLEYGCDNGFSCFDFGRCARDEGTYSFKEQWGARPTPLHWYYISPDGAESEIHGVEKSGFQLAIRFWRRLPVPVTNVVGPAIRKYIGL